MPRAEGEGDALIVSPRLRQWLPWVLACAWAVPAMLRVNDVAFAARVGVLAAGGFALLPVLLAQRAMAAGHFTRRVLPWGLLLSLLPVWALGSLLHAGTHHRPLGAVSFAVLAALLSAASIAVVFRVSQLGSRAWLLARASSALGALWVAWQLRHVAGDVTGSLLDAACGVLAIVAASMLDTTRASSPAAGPARLTAPLAAWVVLGVLALLLVSGAQAALCAQAPLVVGLVAW